jgi:hypothetical protein
MGYATVIEFDVDLDTHRKIIEAVGDGPIDGLIVHAAGSIEAGIRSIDVWESKEQSDRFFAEHLMPAMAKLDIQGGPPLSFEELDAPVLLRG